MGRELRYAIRTLLRRRGFLVATVWCVGCGIGAAAIAAGLATVVYWRLPAGITHPRQVVRIATSLSTTGMHVPGGAVSYPVFAALERNIPAALPIAGYATAHPAIPTLGVSNATTRLVSPGYFQLLGASPARGRLFGTGGGDDDPAARVVVLGYDFWRRHFDGRDDVVGQELRLNDIRFTIVGVAAEHFQGINGGTVDIWAPLGAADALMASGSPLENDALSWIRLVGRLPTGMPPNRVRHILDVAAQTFLAATVQATFSVATLTSPILADRALRVSSAAPARQLTTSVAAIALAILLLMVANVSVLLLARNEARRVEYATRVALGARPTDIVRAVAAEAIVVCTIGGGIGLALSTLASDVLRLIPGPTEEFYVDWRIVLILVGLTALTVLAVSVYPAWAATRLAVAETLKRGSAGATPTKSRARSLLVAAQVCFASIVLFGALLFVDGLRRAVHTDTGWALDELVTVANIDRDALAAVRDRLATIPGVRSVSLMDGTPFHIEVQTFAHIRGSSAQPLMLHYQAVDADFFRTAGIALRAGRDFTQEDMGATPTGIIVNEALARQLGRSPEQALGMCLQLPPANQCARIVGVVRDVTYRSLDSAPTPLLYTPIRPNGHLIAPSLLVRTSSDAMTDVMRNIRSALGGQLLRNGPPDTGRRRPVQIIPTRQLLAREVTGIRNKALCFAVFGLAALGIAAAGLFAVQSFTTSLRLREVGIRRALGASPRQVVSVLAGRAAESVATGLAVGGALSLLLYATIRDLLFRPEGAMPVSTFLVVVLLFAVTGAIAVAGPIRRALKLPASVVLRSE